MAKIDRAHRIASNALLGFHSTLRGLDQAIGLINEHVQRRNEDIQGHYDAIDAHHDSIEEIEGDIGVALDAAHEHLTVKGRIEQILGISQEPPPEP
jgi:hypothetical protein